MLSKDCRCYDSFLHSLDAVGLRRISVRCLALSDESYGHPMEKMLLLSALNSLRYSVGRHSVRTKNEDMVAMNAS